MERKNPLALVCRAVSAFHAQYCCSYSMRITCAALIFFMIGLPNSTLCMYYVNKMYTKTKKWKMFVTHNILRRLITQTQNSNAFLLLLYLIQSCGKVPEFPQTEEPNAAWNEQQINWRSIYSSISKSKLLRWCCCKRIKKLVLTTQLNFERKTFSTFYFPFQSLWPVVSTITMITTMAAIEWMDTFFPSSTRCVRHSSLKLCIQQSAMHWLLTFPPHSPKSRLVGFESIFALFVCRFVCFLRFLRSFVCIWHTLVFTTPNRPHRMEYKRNNNNMWCFAAIWKLISYSSLRKQAPLKSNTVPFHIHSVLHSFTLSPFWYYL